MRNIKITQTKKRRGAMEVTFRLQFENDPESTKEAMDKMLQFIKSSVPPEEFQAFAEDLLAEFEKHKQASVAHGCKG